ncbi:phenoloxidase-activating factor 2 [Tribolium castaneum]|uniref:Phenoloxidase-activating factor 2 n=1 Tax=Tribolium castaneum TaxID=7070 RepID=A0A139W9S1_TRICA|nr:PREDICTED: anionic trypsin-2-like [Tribolium castaneum]KYB24665.1 Serine proteinase stubble-like Protein [Tribolium castaneum]|eukprot:XP_970214.1 PREDICTED: anionic trypsin-2-like [Tribolium castaneum]
MALLTLSLIILSIGSCLSANCICVPFWKCNDENFSTEDLDLVGFRSGCESYFDVCCTIKCGLRKSEIVIFEGTIRNRILGPENSANFGEFPWMLGVLSGRTYRCGASLIHPKVALTAAHCVHSNGFYKVRAGEWDWNSRKEPLKHQDRLAKKIIIHPGYDPNSLINDIALIILDRDFQLSENVGVVCLPPHNSEPLQEECVVSGWGKTHKSGKHQTVLNKAVFPIVPNSRCETALQRAHLGPLFRLHSSFMCAGGKEKDTCKGDGGSPLVCGVQGEEERYEQFGIVSWGLVCGTTDSPGVYVSVAQFVAWIDQQVLNENLDNQIYKY